MRCRIRTTRWALLPVVATFVACEIDLAPVDSGLNFPVPADVTMIPADSMVLSVGDTAEVEALVFDTAGRFLSFESNWSVRDTTVVTLGADSLPNSRPALTGEAHIMLRQIINVEAMAAGSTFVVAVALFTTNNNISDSVLVIVR